MLATASVVAGDASARTTTSMGNTITTKHSHLMMCVLTGDSLSHDECLLKTFASAMFHLASTVLLACNGDAHHNTNVWENHNFKNAISFDAHVQYV